MTTVYARTRIMLALAVVVLAGGIWLVVAEQRDAILRSQAQTAGAGALLTAMLDQETGVRGFDQTAAAEFLAPFNSGRADFRAALAAAERGAGGDAELIAQVRRQGATGERWHTMAESAVAQVRAQGADSLTIAGARQRKAVMDEFRRRTSPTASTCTRSAGAAVRMQIVGLVLVVAIGALLLGGGLWLIERSARRAERRRRAEREFVETLQGADDESEAQELLKRHVERSLAGAAAVVLSRNASGNQLDREHRSRAVPGLAERLDGAARATASPSARAAYSRSASEEPLLPCGICGALPGASRCTPVARRRRGDRLAARHPRSRSSRERGWAVATPSPRPRRCSRTCATSRSPRPRGHDSLTGLPNRRAMRRHAQTHGRASRTAPAHRCQRVVLDLDHFKRDQRPLGHGKGDDVLAAVGAESCAGLRASDFAGRFGGEEFLCCCRTQTSTAPSRSPRSSGDIARWDPRRPTAITASLGVAVAARRRGLRRRADPRRRPRALRREGGRRNRVARAGDAPFATAASG